MDGPMSFRMLGVLGGSAMIVVGFLAFLSRFFSLSMLQAVLSVYTFFFGFVIVMLEGQGMFYPPEWKKTIKKQAKFLTLLNGRGAFYVFIGTLLIVQWPDYAQFLIGAYMVLLGVAMFVVGLHSKTKLDKMRTLLQDENVVRAAFDAVDAEGDGSLTAEELGALCTNLGSTLEVQELEAALQTLDKNGNNKIEFAEFMAWWKGGAQTGVSGFLY